MSLNIWGVASISAGDPTTVRSIFEDDHAAFAESFRAFVTLQSEEPDVVARAGENGLLGMEVPEQYGGAGVKDPRFCAVALEELVGAGKVGQALAYASQVGVGVAVLTNYANSEQQRTWLPTLATGKSTIAVATEIVSGTPTGNGDIVVLDGSCRAVLNGGPADVALIPIQIDREDVVRLAVVDPTAAGVYRTSVDALALASAGLAEFTFASAEVTWSALLPAAAWALLRTAFRLWSAVIAVAGARVAVDWTCGYVRERTVFGRPVAAFENTRQVLGGLSAELTAAQSFIDQCVRWHGAHSLTAAQAAAAKLTCSDLFGRAADEGLQLHGGYGYMREYPISELFADSRFFRWLPEPNESLRLELARELKL
ncbi:acyl-CoA dehydrogenase family protein [Mycobacterium avium]